MPTSNINVIPRLVHQLVALQPRRVLDVGPGNGKYGLLAREYLPDLEVLHAVEAEARYPEMFPWLHAIYDTVIVDDVLNLETEVFRQYDLVMMIDVIEHIDKTLAFELINRIPCTLLISTPNGFMHQHLDDWPTEEHRSGWSMADLLALPRSATVMVVRDGQLLACLDPA